MTTFVGGCFGRKEGERIWRRGGEAGEGKRPVYKPSELCGGRRGGHLGEGSTLPQHSSSLEIEACSDLMIVRCIILTWDSRQGQVLLCEEIRELPRLALVILQSTEYEKRDDGDGVMMRRPATLRMLVNDTQVDSHRMKIISKTALVHTPPSLIISPRPSYGHGTNDRPLIFCVRCRSVKKTWLHPRF